MPTSLKPIWNQVCWQTLLNVRAQFRGTRGGLLWVALRPLVLVAVYHWVFANVLRIGHAAYPVFLLVGIAPWIFLSTSWSQLASGLAKHRGLVFSAPTRVLPAFLADTLANYIYLLLTFSICGVPLFLAFDVPLSHLLWVPFTTLPLIGVAVGGGLILAVCQAQFRDTQFLLPTLLRTWFLFTPIVYPMDLVPAQFSWTVVVNPLFHLLAPIQVLVGGAALPAPSLASSYTVAACTLAVAHLVWIRQRGKVALFV